MILARMRTLFLINPRSGAGRNFERIEAEIRDRCTRHRVLAAVELCPDRSELTPWLQQKERDGYEVICSVGGDGTVHTIGTRLIGSSMAMAILPTGSGNGIARHLGIPMNMTRAIDAALTGRVESIDTLAVNDLPFLGILGIGFDAEIAHRFDAAGTRGLSTYLRVGVRAWREAGELDYEISTDGQWKRFPALLIAVANTNQYGNEARIAPHASVQDGLADICVLRRPSVAAVPLLLAQLFGQNFDQCPWLTIFRASSLTIQRPAPGPAHVDGEPIELPSTLEIVVRPASLRVVVPSSVKNI